MRSKARIKPFLAELEKLWKKYPDFRFWQLVLLLNDEFDRDPFFMEEDEMLKYIQKLAEKKP